MPDQPLVLCPSCKIEHYQVKSLVEANEAEAYQEGYEAGKDAAYAAMVETASDALKTARAEALAEAENGLRDVITNYPYEITGKSEVLALLAGYFCNRRTLKPCGSTVFSSHLEPTVSVCGQCGSMTKTIDGKCGKCNRPKT